MPDLFGVSSVSPVEVVFLARQWNLIGEDCSLPARHMPENPVQGSSCPVDDPLRQPVREDECRTADALTGGQCPELGHDARAD